MKSAILPLIAQCAVTRFGDQTESARETKTAFGRMIDSVSAVPVLVETRGRGVVVSSLCEVLVSGPKFQLERVSGAPVSNDEILSDLRRAAELAGTTVVTQKLYSEFGRYNPSTALRRFGTWNNAVVAAGLQIANEINLTDERLFENIMLLWEHFGRQPRRAELGKPPSVISQSAYLRRFDSWTDALTQFVAYANAKDTRPPGPVEISKGHKTGRDVSLRLRFRVMKRDNFSCRACGASPALEPGLTLHVDHIVAWSLGGETLDENLQTLCEPCNLGKSNVL